MYEYEQDLQEVNRLRRVINEFRDDLDSMIRNRDRGREVRSGRVKKACYYTMQSLSETYIDGIASETRKLGQVVSPEDLEAAEEILSDIEEIVDDFAAEELDEEDNDEDCYYDYS